MLRDPNLNLTRRTPFRISFTTKFLRSFCHLKILLINVIKIKNYIFLYFTSKIKLETSQSYFGVKMKQFDSNIYYQLLFIKIRNIYYYTKIKKSKLYFYGNLIRENTASSVTWSFVDYRREELRIYCRATRDRPTNSFQVPSPGSHILNSQTNDRGTDARESSWLPVLKPSFW